MFGWPLTVAMAEPSTDCAWVETEATSPLALPTMPVTWLVAPLIVLVSCAFIWSMPATGLAEASVLTATWLLPSVSKAMEPTPAALRVPMPRARAQRGMTSNMMVALPFSCIAPIRLSGDAQVPSVRAL